MHARCICFLKSCLTDPVVCNFRQLISKYSTTSNLHTLAYMSHLPSTTQILFCHLKVTLPQTAFIKVTRLSHHTLKWDGLEWKPSLYLLSVMIKRLHTARLAPAPDKSCAALQRSVLDWSGLEKPWQTPRIILQSQSSAICSKWILILKPTRRTSREGKNVDKHKVRAQRFDRISPQWMEWPGSRTLLSVFWNNNTVTDLRQVCTEPALRFWLRSRSIHFYSLSYQSV